MTRFVFGLVLFGWFACIPAQAQKISDAPFLFRINHQGPSIGYGVGGNVFYNDPSVTPWSTIVVGGQFNSRVEGGNNQMAWGIAAEAWALPGSRSVLVGTEASVINMEPSNTLPKYGSYITFKNRPDGGVAPPETMNEASVALMIDAQAETGFERGIVFRRESLHPSKQEPKPVAIDFSEIPIEKMRNIVLVRYPDGYCKYYLGQGIERIRPCDQEAYPLERRDSR